VTSMLRVSPHIYNTLEELERCAEVVRGLSS
jgi:selenocysteine lyase/cysteine desulfurase